LELKRKVFLEILKEEEGAFESEIRNVVENVDKLM